jgi:transcriptional regulator with XRE-family HTH domain
LATVERGMGMSRQSTTKGNPALSQFLRNHREKVIRAKVRLPPKLVGEDRDKGVSQEEAAKRVSVTLRHWGRLERGEAPLSEELAGLIAQKLCFEERERVELWRIVFKRDPPARRVEQAGAELSTSWMRRLSRIQADEYLVGEEGQYPPGQELVMVSPRPIWVGT